MKNKTGLSFVKLQPLFINLIVFPLLLALDFLYGKISPHRELCLPHVKRFFDPHKFLSLLLKYKKIPSLGTRFSWYHPTSGVVTTPLSVKITALSRQFLIYSEPHPSNRSVMNGGRTTSHHRSSLNLITFIPCCCLEISITVRRHQRRYPGCSGAQLAHHSCQGK